LSSRNRAADEADVQFPSHRAQIIDVRRLAGHVAKGSIMRYGFSGRWHNNDPYETISVGACVS
jgi:hypothetical protein